MLHSPIYNNERFSLLSTIRSIDCKLLKNTDSLLTQTLLYGYPSFDINTNSHILNAAIDFILSTKRFEEALFYRNNQCFFFCCYLKNNQSTLCFISTIQLVFIFNTNIFNQFILVFFSFPDTPRIFQCLVYVKF